MQVARPAVPLLSGSRPQQADPSASRSTGETQHLLQGVLVIPTIGAKYKRVCFGHGRRCEAPRPHVWDTRANFAVEPEAETAPNKPRNSQVLGGFSSSTHSTWAPYVWDTSAGQLSAGSGPCTSVVSVQVATHLRRPHRTNQAQAFSPLARTEEPKRFRAAKPGSSRERTGPLHSAPTHPPPSPHPTSFHRGKTRAPMADWMCPRSLPEGRPESRPISGVVGPKRQVPHWRNYRHTAPMGPRATPMCTEPRTSAKPFRGRPRVLVREPGTAAHLSNTQHAGAYRERRLDPGG